MTKCVDYDLGLDRDQLETRLSRISIETRVLSRVRSGTFETYT
jgi:hypothetical protein